MMIHMIEIVNQERRRLTIGELAVVFEILYYL